MLPTDATQLIERARVARIATVSSNGRPHVNPLWFVVDGDRVLLGTAVHTLAARNATANAAVQVLFEDESAPADDRELRIDGTATVRTDADTLKRYRRGVARRYMATPGGLWNLLSHVRQWPAFRRHVGSGDPCVIEVEPTGSTWLHRRPD